LKKEEHLKRILRKYFELGLVWFVVLSSAQEHASMTLTKDHPISSIRNRLGLAKFESSRILESVLETVKTSLSNGENVLISGFGKFIVKEKGARRGRNPATGEDLTLDARTVVMFRCSPVMRERINPQRDPK
jgi:integration host factor subunit alpha